MYDDDEQLIAAYLAGDEAALEVLLHRYFRPVYNFVARLVGDSDAPDVVQEAFFKAWRSIGRFKEGASFRAWLFAIARNTAIDRLRKHKAVAFSMLDTDTESFADTVVDDAPLADTVADHHVLLQQLEDGLEQLSPLYQEIVLLHDMEELTFEEIAATVGRPMNTVKSQYRRALAQLRALLQEKGDTRADAPNG